MEIFEVCRGRIMQKLKAQFEIKVKPKTINCGN